MGLAETLSARVLGQGRTAQADCGELGSVTVEALPLRELEGLLRGTDGRRAVFYAACRELQQAGESLRQSGQIFTPDQIMQFVSDAEADAAAETVLALSGWTGGEPGEVRLPSVQEQDGEIRLSSVQMEGAENPVSSEVRPETVQMVPADSVRFGQVSHETEAFAGRFAEVADSDRKTQSLGDLPVGQTQNVVSAEIFTKALRFGGGGGNSALHEIRSELKELLRELLHEIESESGGSLHETESEFGGGGRLRLHETESEMTGGVHETESDFGEKSRLSLHETESELAERLARHLLEGLRRANWVRGG